MPNYFNFFARLAVSSLLCLVLAPQSRAGEPIARIEQSGKVLANSDTAYQLTIHSVAWLSNITVGKFKIAELSGLAWDSDEGLLYALSDNGYLLLLKPRFQEQQMVSLTLEDARALLDERGRPLKYKPSDSEGLAVINDRNSTRGDTELLVCFERIPRILRFDLHGNMLEKLELPAGLDNINFYHSENKSLESVAVHPVYGVITGTELPLKQESDGQMNIYALSGKHWSFPPFNPHYGALVDLAIMQDGGVLALERAYGGLFPIMEITLHHLVLEDESLHHEIIYTFDSRDGLFDENFEGITRHEDNAYFMISDDNNHPLHRTVLVYFSIMPSARETTP